MTINRDVLKREAAALDVINQVIGEKERALIAAWIVTYDQVSGELLAALDELTAANINGTVTRTQLLRSQRLQEAIRAVEAALDQITEQSGIILTSGLWEQIHATTETQVGMIASQLPRQIGTGTTRLLATSVVAASSEQIAAMVERVTQRMTSAVRELSVEAKRAIRVELLRSISVGANPRVAARRALQRVEGQFDGGLGRALTIARTEQLDAHRAAAQTAELANQDVLAGWTWVAHLGPRTCRACLAMHGREFPLTQAGPEGHQNCVLPGAVVSGPRAVASTTRWFDGEVIDFETRAGRILSVTPNHPILTPHGWVAAGDLREGGDVIAGTGTEGISLLGRPDDHQVPALIEDVAQTLGGAAPVEAVSVPTAPEDFHGDGAGSDVHVVRTHSLLGDHVEPAGAQFVGESAFMFRDMCLEAFARSGDAGTMFRRLLGAAHRIVGRSYPGRFLFGSSLGHHEPVGVSVAPLRHTCGIETVIDGRPGDAIGARESVDGFPGEVSSDDFGGRNIGLGGEARAGFGRGEGVSGGFVAPESTLHQSGLESRFAYPMPTSGDLAAFAGDVIADRIVKIGRRRWSGHVYNLQTDTGWYLANDIITHNCRCTRVPRTKTWAELGIAGVKDRKPAIKDAEQHFRSLPVEDQKAILGANGYAAWKAGLYPMSDWVRKQKNDGWRDSWTATRPPAVPITA